MTKLVEFSKSSKLANWLTSGAIKPGDFLLNFSTAPVKEHKTPLMVTLNMLLNVNIRE